MKIEIRNLSKRFGNNLVINNVNMVLEEGKIYGILGDNKSGKSLLLKMIAGFYIPNTGSIIINGIDIVKTNSFAKDTSVLIENPTFLPYISGFDNLYMLSKIENRITKEDINKALDLVNLNENDRLKEFENYSLGMKQKLGIAQVIMEDSKIMVLDEPFNSIEKSTIIKITNYLEKIKSNKIIIITSSLKESLTLADEIYKIDNGIITKI